jgi:hypothetical protein
VVTGSGQSSWHGNSLADYSNRLFGWNIPVEAHRVAALMAQNAAAAAGVGLRVTLLAGPLTRPRLLNPLFLRAGALRCPLIAGEWAGGRSPPQLGAAASPVACRCRQPVDIQLPTPHPP